MTARMHGARWTDVVVVVLLAISLIVAVGMVKGRSLHGNDYKHLWAGAWLLAHDQDPYDEALLRGVAWRFRIDRAHPNQPRINPYVYLPTTGLLMRPLAGMPYRRSQVAWHWMNWLLAWTLAIAGPSLMGVARPARARLAGACFLVAAMPFFRQMSAGQMNVVTAALIVAAVWALRRRRATILGLLLALGTAWKIAPVILLAALTAMRRWRAAFWGGVFCVALFGASVALVGWPIHREALGVVAQMGYGQSTWGGREDFYRQPFNQSPNALMHHLFTEQPYTQPWVNAGPAVANALTWVVSLAILAAWAWGWRRRRMDKKDQKNVALPPPAVISETTDADTSLFLAATLAMLLLPSLMWDHYCVQALPALMWLFGSASAARGLWRAAAALLVFTLLVVPWLPTTPINTSGAGILLMSLRLWPLLGLYAWLLAMRTSDTLTDC